MNTVLKNSGVNSGMKLDTGYLCTRELAFCPNVMDMVIFYQTEGYSHTTAHTGLLASKNLVVTDNVGADVFLAPSIP